MTREDLDVTEESSVESMFRSGGRPDVLVNTAAFTAVDAAESSPGPAVALNADAPGLLARSCCRFGIRFVHISTDYVFDGQADTPYPEDHVVSPASVYGRTKADGESTVLTEHPDGALILRTSWLFSEFSPNFVTTMIRLAGERREISVVADQTGCPTDAENLALAILGAVDQRLVGIAHYSDGPATTWARFAEAIFSRAVGAGLLARSPRVVPISTAEYPTAAARPSYSVLANNRIRFRAGWEQGLQRVIAALHQDSQRG